MKKDDILLNWWRVMVKNKKAKHTNRYWHHRVPDYQLVYCGPEGLDEDGRLLVRGETKREHFQKLPVDSSVKVARSKKP